MLGRGQLELGTDTVQDQGVSNSQDAPVPGIRFSIVYVDQIRVMMTLRISQVAVVCGLGWLALPGVVLAQAPRYQSPLSMPNAPQQQVTLPVTPAITPNGTVVEDVVAHVNDLIISRSDVQRAEEALAQENQRSEEHTSELQSPC